MKYIAIFLLISVFLPLLLVFCLILVGKKNKIKPEKDLKQVTEIMLLGAKIDSLVFAERINLVQNIITDQLLIITGTKKECNYALQFFHKKEMIIDPSARNTWDNIYNNLVHMSENTLIITNDFHVLRVKLICRKLNLNCAVRCNDQNFYYRSYFREVLAIVKYFIVYHFKDNK